MQINEYEGRHELHDMSDALAELRREAARRGSRATFALAERGSKFTVTCSYRSPFPQWAEAFLRGYFIGKQILVSGK